MFKKNYFFFRRTRINKDLGVVMVPQGTWECEEINSHHSEELMGDRQKESSEDRI